MEKLKQKILILASSVFLVSSLSPALVLADAKTDIQCGANNAAGEKCDAKVNPTNDLNDIIAKVINLLSIIVGIIAVIMIIIAGFRYITSAGSAEKVSAAKNTLMYAIIGLVIVALAQVIVRFVLNKTTQQTP
jgi:cytochrome bd-type quinol oxidase subunit 2